jgi:hypothetical protein
VHQAAAVVFTAVFFFSLQFLIDSASQPPLSFLLLPNGPSVCPSVRLSINTAEKKGPEGTTTTATTATTQQKQTFGANRRRRLWMKEDVFRLVSFSYIYIYIYHGV